MGARIERADLDASLAALALEVRDPRLGLFGPDTISWRISREAALFLGAGRAALLQLAHPFVAQAVHDHSETRRDPAARFRATFHQIFRMAFGELDEAVRAGRAVHRVHERITGALEEATGSFARGHRYEANDRDAQVWVLATLWDTSVLVYESLFGTLSEADRNRYVLEGQRMAMLFGIERAMPRTWGAFRAYVDRMIEGGSLGVTRVGRDLATRILSPEGWLGRAVRDEYTTLTAWLLPERFSREFGLDRAGSEGHRRARRVLSAARHTAPLLPEALRFVPGYLEATARLRGDAGAGVTTAWMSALYTGRRPRKGPGR